MSKLADCFPDGMRIKHVQNIIKARSVIRLFDHSCRPPKLKRFIIVGENETHFGSLIINTEINPNVFPANSKGYPFQIQIKKNSGCTYLTHDSYVDCTFIYPWDKKVIFETLLDKNENILGELMSDHWERVIEAIIRNRAIPVKKKKLFGIL